MATAVQCLGKLGVCAMVGGAAPTEAVTLNHSEALLNGKRLIGIMGGGGYTPHSLTSLMRLQAAGRFPLERLVCTYDFTEIERAIDDSDSGAVVKPVLRMA